MAIDSSVDGKNDSLIDVGEQQSRFFNRYDVCSDHNLYLICWALQAHAENAPIILFSLKSSLQMTEIVRNGSPTYYIYLKVLNPITIWCIQHAKCTRQAYDRVQV